MKVSPSRLEAWAAGFLGTVPSPESLGLKADGISHPQASVSPL